MSPRDLVVYDEIPQPEPRLRPKDPPLQWPWAEARAQVLDMYTRKFLDGPVVNWHGLMLSRRDKALIDDFLLKEALHG